MGKFGILLLKSCSFNWEMFVDEDREGGEFADCQSVRTLNIV